MLYVFFMDINAKKSTSCGNNAIDGSNKTSWSIPRMGIVDTSYIGMSALGSYANHPIVVYSYAVSGGYYNVNIYGSPNQVGTDTMNIKFDLDYS
ncbi:MAG: hypothetical protein ACOX45_07415 [Acutalibacteraceae bacterium]